MKKYLSIKLLITTLALIIIFFAINSFTSSSDHKDYRPDGDANIYLYGEAHGIKEFYDAEIEEWLKFYNEGCVDLYVELPYYEAMLLNEYMRAEDEDLLFVIYDAMEGTPSYTPDILTYYRTIKEKAPDTVFHGTDLGHQFFSLGVYYLEFLESRGLENSPEYERCQIIMKQGDDWYNLQNCDNAIREKEMVENFIWDYDLLKESKGRDVKIMGIYGGAHTRPLNDSKMAGMLKSYYGDIIACTYITNSFIDCFPYKIGFSYLGVIFLLLLFIPNIIFGITVSDEMKLAMANENKVLLAFERVGQVLACMALVIFPANNPRFFFKAGICCFFADRFAFLVMAVILMLIYELYWIRYFRSPRKPSDFYYSYMGIPLSGASLPCIALLFIGIYAGNLVTVLAALILSIGHIGIHVWNDLHTERV